MRKLLLALLPFMALSTVASADFVVTTSGLRDKTDLEVKATYGPHGEFVLRAVVNTPGTYSLLVNFPETDNYPAQSLLRALVTRDTVLLRLHPLDARKPGFVDFRYHSVPGDVLGGADADFVYRLPFSAWRAPEMPVSGNRYESVRLDPAIGDSLFAMRKGIVTQFHSYGSPDTGEYANLSVRHADGTVLGYHTGKTAGTFARGDTVYPGTYLGMMPVYEGEAKTWATNLREFYADTLNRSGTARFLSRPIPMRFATPLGVVAPDSARRPLAAFVNDEMITREMTPDEVRRYRAGRLNVTAPPRAQASRPLSSLPSPGRLPAPLAAKEDTVWRQISVKRATPPITPTYNVYLYEAYTSDGTYLVKANNRSYGTYAVALDFISTPGYDLRPVRETLAGQASRILVTVPPVAGQKRGKVECRPSYAMCVREAKADTAFVCRIPFDPAIKEIVSMRSSSGTARTVFYAPREQTVYPVRAGIVVATTTGSALATLTIQHRDGTWASYSGFKVGSLMVSEGRQVWPDTPLGLTVHNASMDYWWISVDVRRIVPASKPDGAAFASLPVNPVFATAAGAQRLTSFRVYTPLVTRELIQREMTPDEKAETNKKR